jgi:hypothetical protein
MNTIVFRSVTTLIDKSKCSSEYTLLTGSVQPMNQCLQADCTLCDMVVDALRHVNDVEGVDFSLNAVDITDPVCVHAFHASDPVFFLLQFCRVCCINLLSFVLSIIVSVRFTGSFGPCTDPFVLIPFCAQGESRMVGSLPARHPRCSHRVDVFL